MGALRRPSPFPFVSQGSRVIPAQSSCMYSVDLIYACTVGIEALFDVLSTAVGEECRELAISHRLRLLRIRALIAHLGRAFSGCRLAAAERAGSFQLTPPLSSCCMISFFVAIGASIQQMRTPLWHSHLLKGYSIASSVSFL